MTISKNESAKVWFIPESGDKKKLARSQLLILIIPAVLPGVLLKVMGAMLKTSLAVSNGKKLQ